MFVVSEDLTSYENQKDSFWLVYWSLEIALDELNFVFIPLMTLSPAIHRPLDEKLGKGIVSECHDRFVVMSLLAETSSRDTLRPLTATEDRRRTGRYVAGGTALAIILLAIHHILLRGAPTIAGICIPAIIMATYVIWVLYSVRRDRRKARLLASAMQLTEVISVPHARSIVNDDATTAHRDINGVATRDFNKHIIA